MNLEKIRQMTDIERENELLKLKTELFNLRFQHVTGQLENPLKLREVRRDVARIKTVMREKELAAEQLGA
jgi:large subunit ribosomal protein L29